MVKMMEPYLREMVQKNASDLYISVDAPPCLKMEGKITPVSTLRLDECQVPVLVDAVLNDEERARFEQERELDLALAVEGIGRFRINVYHQRGLPAMVVRHVRDDIPTIKQLRLPEIFEQLSMEHSGLIVVAGNTGAGKSTTLASLVHHRNQNACNHILTIEYPIEYWHKNARSIVDQREVGLDTQSYASALKHAMREDPDLILVGETRDYDALRHVVSFADSGHLCLTSMHAHSAAQVIHRMVNFYPEQATKELLMNLSVNLKAIVCQRLVPGTDGRRVLAMELMLNTPYMAELIRNNKLNVIPEAIEKGADTGCISMDRSLRMLWQTGQISEETAMSHASSRTNMRLDLRQLHARRGARVA